MSAPLYTNVNRPIQVTADTTDQEIAHRALHAPLDRSCVNLLEYVMKLERRIAVLEGRKE